MKKKISLSWLSENKLEHCLDISANHAFIEQFKPWKSDFDLKADF